MIWHPFNNTIKILISFIMYISVHAGCSWMLMDPHLCHIQRRHNQPNCLGSTPSKRQNLWSASTQSQRIGRVFWIFLQIRDTTDPAQADRMRPPAPTVCPSRDMLSKGWPARESRVKIHQISQFAKSHITKHSSYSSIRAKLASEIYGLATQMSGLLTGTTSLWCVVTPRGMRDELWAKS